MRCTAGAGCGYATETTGVLKDSVCVRRAAWALRRGRMPMHKANSTSARGAKRNSRVFKDRRDTLVLRLDVGSLAFNVLLPLVCGQSGRRRGPVRLAALEPSM